MRGIWTALLVAAAACSASMDNSITVDSGPFSPMDGPRPADARIDALVVDAAPSVDVCGPAPTQGAQSCAMPGPGGTVPECTTTKMCTVSGCGDVTHDPDCIAECMRCSLCAVCNRQTHQWAVMPLDFCVPFGPCPDGGTGDAGNSAKL